MNRFLLFKHTLFDITLTPPQNCAKQILRVETDTATCAFDFENRQHTSVDAEIQVKESVSLHLSFDQRAATNKSSLRRTGAQSLVFILKIETSGLVISGPVSTSHALDDLCSKLTQTETVES